MKKVDFRLFPSRKGVNVLVCEFIYVRFFMWIAIDRKKEVRVFSQSLQLR